MALILQTMVNAQYSGVLFTSSPLRKRNNQTHIEWVEGFGENLVDGRITPKRVFIDKNDKNFDFADENVNSSFYKSFHELISTTSTFTNLEQRELDFEWSIDQNNKLWFLQMRPITKSFEKNIDDNYILAYDEAFSTFGIQLAIDRYFFG